MPLMPALSCNQVSEQWRELKALNHNHGISLSGLVLSWSTARLL